MSAVGFFIVTFCDYEWSYYVVYYIKMILFCQLVKLKKILDIINGYIIVLGQGKKFQLLDFV